MSHALPRADVMGRLAADNPWWSDELARPFAAELPQRDHFAPFFELAADCALHRAVVLMGPRRVGKTVLLHQVVDNLLKQGAERRQILFATLDAPAYTGLELLEFVELAAELAGFDPSRPGWVIFDEIQYMQNWEHGLDALAARWPALRCTACGSAAPALRRMGDAEAAGRFAVYMLPPLSFAEFLRLSGGQRRDMKQLFTPERMGELNELLVRYMNFGGYPEAVVSERVRSDMTRFLRSEIIDRVLCSDLPGLYGISDVQELNRLLAVLALNSGREVTLEDLRGESGIAVNTLKRYLDYLEAAFLVVRLRRIDDAGRRFRRDRSFKVYLANPSMRTALFAPITGPDDPALQPLLETAVVGQLLCSPALSSNTCYARWDGGDVALVGLHPVHGKPVLAFDIRWSDEGIATGNGRCGVRNDAAAAEDATRASRKAGGNGSGAAPLRPLFEFARRHNVRKAYVTTRSTFTVGVQGNTEFSYLPAGMLAFTLSSQAAERIFAKLVTVE
ncbi:ATP-binding protein [Nitratidesulfovibrio sp. HK-II]|uniref:ATP-binding protein n=1 Tax=Nitratidesulfovibrio sp. HK-II TaxID=2009266 RepID=UPI000E2F8740|nr:ATP-binding protein [Nitratidesulfovibrio sp. HK-II]GBO97101.1 hypothetical protein RVX_2140 [Nitratidesulfovibrio sp. HK-II]